MTAPAPPAAPRRFDLDWLRIGATFLLFPFHVGKVFDVLPMYHVKSPTPVAALDHVTSFVHWWHMPLFFVLAGWSAHGSIARRGPGAFLRERTRRLLVPFLTGVVLFCPVIKYVELRSGLSLTASGAVANPTPYDASFFEFLPSFFTRMDRFTWSHLWFLLYLFTFSLVLAPLLARLARPRVAPARASTLGLYLPLLPLALIQVILRPRWPGVQNLYDDWANVAYYATFFLLGFALARTPAWDDVIARESRRAGLIGLAAAATLSLAWTAIGRVGLGALAGRPLAVRIAMLTLTAVVGWGVVVGLLGWARRHLAFTTPTQRRLAEASLPIYVLHQAAIVVPAYGIVRTEWPIPIQLTVLLVVALATTLGAYHYGVRRSALLSAALGRARSDARNGQSSCATTPAGAYPSASP